MDRPLLLHSLAEFESITLPILELIQAKHIAEIGAEHGGNSKLLFDWVSAQNGTLHSIDPKPSSDFYAWLKDKTHRVNHIEKPSLDGISECGAIDAWFVDGDHNWYTVFNELNLIHESSEKYGTKPVIFLHDVCWPCGRRDMYYAPERIPESYRHPHDWEKGITLDHHDMIDGGFRGHGQLAFAKHAGGEKNGVLTAIEDFLRPHEQTFCFALIPAIFGLGIIFPASHPKAEEISTFLLPYHQHPLIAALEENRLMNYLKVIEWQDKETEAES